MKKYIAICEITNVGCFCPLPTLHDTLDDAIEHLLSIDGVSITNFEKHPEKKHCDLPDNLTASGCQVICGEYEGSVVVFEVDEPQDQNS